MGDRFGLKKLRFVFYGRRVSRTTREKKNCGEEQRLERVEGRGWRG
jgi:hypothetical protein